MVSLTDQSKRPTRSVKGRDTYTGTMRGGVVGQYYYRHRVYGAEVGRFLTRDPIGYEGLSNLLAYVADRPTTLVDPGGQWPLAPWNPKADWWFGWENWFANEEVVDDVVGGCASCGGTAAPGGLGEFAGGLGCVAAMCEPNNMENYLKRQMDVFEITGPQSEYLRWKRSYEQCKGMRERSARERAEELRRRGCCD